MYSRPSRQADELGPMPTAPADQPNGRGVENDGPIGRPAYVPVRGTRSARPAHLVCSLAKRGWPSSIPSTCPCAEHACQQDTVRKERQHERARKQAPEDRLFWTL